MMRRHLEHQKAKKKKRFANSFKMAGAIKRKMNADLLTPKFAENLIDSVQKMEIIKAALKNVISSTPMHADTQLRTKLAAIRIADFTI